MPSFADISLHSDLGLQRRYLVTSAIKRDTRVPSSPQSPPHRPPHSGSRCVKLGTCRAVVTIADRRTRWRTVSRHYIAVREHLLVYDGPRTIPRPTCRSVLFMRITGGPSDILTLPLNLHWIRPSPHNRQRCTFACYRRCRLYRVYAITATCRSSLPCLNKDHHTTN